MAFWNKGKEIKDDDLPESLRGKTPEEIAQFLKDAAALQTTVQTLTADKTRLETEVNTHKTELDSVKTKVAELEAKTTPPPDKPPEPEEPASVWTDPDKWLQERTKGLEGATLMSGMMTARMVAENGLNAQDRKLWSKFSKEIDQTMQGFTPQQRILPQSWMIALNVVKGNHMHEILESQTKGNDFFAEEGSRTNLPPPETEVKLTADEELACKTFRWDPKRYLEQKKKMVTAVSDRGGYAHFGVD